MMSAYTPLFLGVGGVTLVLCLLLSAWGGPRAGAAEPPPPATVSAAPAPLADSLAANAPAGQPR